MFSRKPAYLIRRGWRYTLLAHRHTPATGLTLVIFLTRTAVFMMVEDGLISVKFSRNEGEN